MKEKQFEVAYRAFSERRPFRPFLIEFTSGNQLLISHPEAVRRREHFFVMRRPDGGHEVFSAEGTFRLLDLPTKPTQQSAS